MHTFAQKSTASSERPLAALPTLASQRITLASNPSLAHPSSPLQLTMLEIDEMGYAAELADRPWWDALATAYLDHQVDLASTTSPLVQLASHLLGAQSASFAYANGQPQLRLSDRLTLPVGNYLALFESAHHYGALVELLNESIRQRAEFHSPLDRLTAAHLTHSFTR